VIKELRSLLSIRKMAAFIKILLVYTNVVLRLDLATSEEQNLSESHKFNSFKCMQFSIVILRSSQFLQINISTSPAQRYVYLCSWMNLSSVGFYFFCVKGNKIVIGVQHIIYRVFFLTNPRDEALPSFRFSHTQIWQKSCWQIWPATAGVSWRR